MEMYKKKKRSKESPDNPLINSEAINRILDQGDDSTIEEPGKILVHVCDD